MTAIEMITTVFILAGSFFAFLSAVGVLRLHDVYSRMHAAGKSATLGIIFILTGAVLYFIPQGVLNGKLLLAILFVFITAPLSALLLNRSAYRTGVPLAENTVRDDLKEMYDQSL